MYLYIICMKWFIVSVVSRDLIFAGGAIRWCSIRDISRINFLLFSIDYFVFKNYQSMRVESMNMYFLSCHLFQFFHPSTPRAYLGFLWFHAHPLSLRHILQCYPKQTLNCKLWWDFFVLVLIIVIIIIILKHSTCYYVTLSCLFFSPLRGTSCW